MTNSQTNNTATTPETDDLHTIASSVVSNNKKITGRETALNKVNDTISTLTQNHYELVVAYLNHAHAVNHTVSVAEEVSKLMSYAGFRVNRSKANPFGNTKVVKKVYVNVTAFKDFKLSFVDEEQRYNTRIEKVNTVFMLADKAGVSFKDIVECETKYQLEQAIKEHKQSQTPTEAANAPTTTKQDDAAETPTTPQAPDELTVVVLEALPCFQQALALATTLSTEQREKLNHDLAVVLAKYQA